MGLSATYLTRDGASGTVRFYHQLLQEYFAAVGLQQAGLSSRLESAHYDYMPGGWRGDPLVWNSRRPTKWDEVVVALCGIVNHPDEMISRVLENDPSMASHCVATGILLDPETRRKTVDRLVATLCDRRWPVTSAIADALWRLGDPDAAPGLVEILRTGRPSGLGVGDDPREAAALALGGIGGPIAVAGLVEALGCDSKAVRMRAARSLGDIGDPGAVAGLVGLLWDDEKFWLYFYTLTLQEESIKALIQIGKRVPEAVIPAMLDGLQNLEPRIRAASARVLGAVGDRSAIQGLLDAQRYDVDPHVRSQAWHASSAISGK